MGKDPQEGPEPCCGRWCCLRLRPGIVYRACRLGAGLERNPRLLRDAGQQIRGEHAGGRQVVSVLLVRAHVYSIDRFSCDIIPHVTQDTTPSLGSLTFQSSTAVLLCHYLRMIENANTNIYLIFTESVDLILIFPTPP